MQFKVNFTNDIHLVYNLIEHDIVKSWIEILDTRTVKDLCPHNHYIGYVSDDYLNLKIQRLYELADYINVHTPERVIKMEINKETYKEALNIMHVHFPALKNDISYKDIWDKLTEYNDIIHWLESTVHIRWGKIKTSISGLFRITLDFNKSNTEFKIIPSDGYKLFDPNTLFGELKLHYTHVGKNAHELFLNNDLVCPKEQFVPQQLYTASVRMYFTDDFYINTNNWKTYYNKRGKEFWGMEIDDPKLAFGYLKIGDLHSINEAKIPNDIYSRHKFREKLANSRIIDWQII